MTRGAVQVDIFPDTNRVNRTNYGISARRTAEARRRGRRRCADALRGLAVTNCGVPEQARATGSISCNGSVAILFLNGAQETSICQESSIDRTGNGEFKCRSVLLPPPRLGLKTMSQNPFTN